ncbi:MAG TPA: response regulator [Acidobacteriota bacterium]|nr:response regulator [Acidobacteriota bacterium]
MKILVVDDDPATLLVLSLALRKTGCFEVDVAGSGVEAVTCARRRKHDAILLDAVMHDLDGTDVLRQLRADPATDAIPVIFHTAKSEPSEVRRFVSLGAAGVIRKPSDPAELAAEIKKILHRR